MIKNEILIEKSITNNKPVKNKKFIIERTSNTLPITKEPYSTKILVCLTLYNEDATEFLKTYNALLKACEYTYEKLGIEIASKIDICIISDGFSKINPSTLKVIEDLGLIASSNGYNSDDNMTVFQSRIPLGVEKTKKKNPLLGNTFFCVKHTNKGKLDSHWWFFEKFARHLSPEICAQLDVGTIPYRDVFCKSLEYFKSNSEIGAISANLEIINNNNSALIQYQAGEFDFKNAVLMPAEKELGYLTVITGQLSFINWKIAYNNSKGDSPIDNYLDGLNSDTPFKSTMFLAEDRVLGFELISNKKYSCHNTFAGDLKAKTDACQTFTELLKQRKRWINSSFAARIFMKFNLPLYWKNSTSSTLKKMKTVFASITVVLFQTLYCWFLPFLLFKQAVHVHESFQILIGSSMGSFLGIFFIAFGFYPTAVLLLKQEEKITKKHSNFIFTLALIYGATSFLILPIITAFVNKSSLLSDILFLFILLMFLTTFVIINRTFNFKRIRNFIFYILSNPYIEMLLSGYALRHLNDASWGTKGITNSLNWGMGKCEKSNKKRFNTFKRNVLICYLASNASLIIYTFILNSEKSSNIISFWYLLLIQFLLILITAFINSLKLTIMPRLRFARNNSTHYNNKKVKHQTS